MRRAFTEEFSGLQADAAQEIREPRVAVEGFEFGGDFQVMEHIVAFLIHPFHPGGRISTPREELHERR
jgi:hypothetical protein